MSDAPSDESEGVLVPGEQPWTGDDYDKWLIHMMGITARWKDGDLYHYTTIDGLKGILDSGCLWGTHVAFMNDSQELDYGIGMICDIIKSNADQWAADPKLSKSKNRDADDKLMHKLIDGVHNYLHMNRDIISRRGGTFVSCMSTSADQLSQWRGYGQSGGYAIRFDPKLLGSSIKHVDEHGAVLKGPDPVLVRVEYLPEVLYGEITEMVLSHLHDYIDATEKYEDEREKDEAQITERFKFDKKVTEIASRIKHPKFAEEQEFRIITEGREDFYCPTKLGLVPRVLIKFDRNAIKEIMVGPGEFANVRKLSIDRYIEKNVRWYGGLKVTLSEVPYREV
jgi:Protein of unknown function (DUF2971)